MTADKFQEFWSLYPHKVGKIKAEKKYWIVRRDVAHEVLMDGLRRYIETKPDWRAWCNPETWLNQGRWEDQPAEVQMTQERGPHDRAEVYNSIRRYEPPPELSAEEQEIKAARNEVLDELRREGLNPWLCDKAEIKRRVAERLTRRKRA